jgi:glyoxylase-like metal-dependent hydrolase (beta-lactamase superfamily II)
MIQLSEHIYFMECSYETDRPNLGYIRGDNYALMYEAGASKHHVDDFLDSLAAAGLPKPAFAAISHWHWDHSFGNHYLRENGILTLASRQTNERLREMSAWKWDEASMAARLKSGREIEFVDAMIKLEYPDRDEITVTETDITFSGEMTIDLGGIQCRLIPVDFDICIAGHDEPVTREEFFDFLKQQKA